METSESQDKITTGKAKSPGRVQWGQKVAALSRAHKKAKAERQLQPEPTEAVQESPGKERTGGKLLPWIAVGSLIIGLAGLYYQRRAANAAQQAAVVAPPQPPPEPPASKLIEMR